MIIGRRDEGEDKKTGTDLVPGGEVRASTDNREEDGLLADEVEFEDLEETDMERERKRRREEQDVLELDLDESERRNDVQLL